jgi:hypothetical protein
VFGPTEGGQPDVSWQLRFPKLLVKKTRPIKASQKNFLSNSLEDKAGIQEFAETAGGGRQHWSVDQSSSYPMMPGHRRACGPNRCGN